MLDDSQTKELRTSLRGQLLCPEDSDYDKGRKVFNAMIDRRPGADCPVHGCCGRHRLRALRPRARPSGFNPRWWSQYRRHCGVRRRPRG